jgi:mRNA interferase RelE/StbE
MWKVEYAKRFLRELSDLPKETRERAESIVFNVLPGENPFSLGLLERMAGYPGKYKIRVGDYRIGVKVDNGRQLIIIKRIANRKDIYRIFP